MGEKYSLDASKAAANVASEIKHICKHIDKRFSGSEGEKDAAQYLASKLEASASDVRVEQFGVCPRAYFGWSAFCITCLLLSFAAYFFATLVSLLLLILAIVPYFSEYVVFQRMYDPLCKRKTSSNVYAVKHCEGEVKRRIILVGHYDAGNEWHTKHVFGGALFIAQRALNVIGGFYLLALIIARWVLVGGIGAGIASGPMLYAGLVGIIFCMPWIATYFFVDNKRVIDGANDGLSGCMTAVEAFESLKDIPLENTEVGVLLTGSEAVGFRGAMAFADAHAKEFGDETTFVVLNILREKECMTVNRREANGFVGCDKQAYELVKASARDAGLNVRSRMALFANTDSGVLSARGLKSVGINAISDKLPDYYRTRYDTYDNLSEDCLAGGYTLVMKMIENFSGEVNFEFVSAPAPDGDSDVAPKNGSAPEGREDAHEVSSDESGVEKGEDVSE